MSNNISVLITCSPEAQNQCLNALHYCRELLNQGLIINQVFFYQAGVYHANGLIPDNSGLNINQQWAELSEQYSLPLLVCVGAASKRGIIDQNQAVQSGLSNYTLYPPFKQVGLGEFFTILHNSDKLVQF